MPAITPYPTFSEQPGAIVRRIDDSSYKKKIPDSSLYSLKKGIGYGKVDANEKKEPIIEIIDLDTLLSIGNAKINVPHELYEIHNEILASKTMLDLPYSWDSEGAYQIEPIIWERAVLMLVNYSKWLFENKNLVLASPTISPVSDGSIDLLWHTKKARMLINIKNSEKSEAHYYADLYDKNTFKGCLILEDSVIQEYFAYWLSNLVI